MPSNQHVIVRTDTYGTDFTQTEPAAETAPEKAGSGGSHHQRLPNDKEIYA
jgi:hypothetical protein